MSKIGEASNRQELRASRPVKQDAFGASMSSDPAAVETEQHKAWVEATTQGVAGVCPAADEVWIRAVGELAAIEFQDCFMLQDDGMGFFLPATQAGAVKWGGLYARRMANTAMEIIEEHEDKTAE